MESGMKVDRVWARMDEPALLALCERGVDAALRSGADAAEVYAESSAEMEVSIQKNDLDQVSLMDEVTYGVRVYANGRLGFATANDPSVLAQTAADAVDVARASLPEEGATLPEPAGEHEAGPAVDAELVAMRPEALAQLAMDLLRETRGRDPRITVDTAGLAIGHSVRAIVSSTGVRASWSSAAGSGQIFGMAVDGDQVGSFAYDGDAVRQVQFLRAKVSDAFARFAAQAVGALGAGRGESFRGPIVLSPEALEDVLVGPLLSNLGADAVRKGRSALGGRVGERIASSGFTLEEGGQGLDGYPLCPFDREGLPRRGMALIDDGVLQGFLYDAREARLAGVAPTAHAQGGASALPRVGAGSLRLVPGEHTREALEAMERGVVVTRFSGTTDPVSGDFSGVVKGGFLVRDGERTPIQETTIAGNLWTCLQNISGRSATAELRYGARAWPAVRVEDISITAG